MTRKQLKKNAQKRAAIAAKKSVAPIVTGGIETPFEAAARYLSYCREGAQ